MNALIIFIVLVVLSAIIGAVSQALKNQQQAEQVHAARGRADNRAASDDRREGRAASDIDRFLEEIDKLRRKSAAGGGAPPPVVAPPVSRRANNRPVAPSEVPTVEPVRKPSRVAGDPTFAAPAAPVARSVPTSHRAVAPLPRLEDLPVAPVVVGLSGVFSPSVVTRPRMLADPRPVAKTEFAAQLAALLTSKNAVPMAVVLQEILGPPKCKRG
ncbi:MAG TPA: hypothetical protein VFG68_19250 [Fimbriiglobus sp.]|nr:hypothetical protein [Fimbriiglobus sp.]